LYDFPETCLLKLHVCLASWWWKWANLIYREQGNSYSCCWNMSGIKLQYQILL